MNKTKKLIILAGGIVFIITASIIAVKQEEQVRNTNTVLVSVENLSNQKIGWGIKREENHKQPDLGTKNKQIINEYKGIAMGNS